MTALLTALAPIIVAGITSLIKRIPAFSTLPSGWHTFVVRFIVALLAFLAAVGQAWISGTDVDAMTLQNFADAFQVFLAATGAYFFVKK